MSFSHHWYINLPAFPVSHSSAIQRLKTNRHIFLRLMDNSIPLFTGISLSIGTIRIKMVKTCLGTRIARYATVFPISSVVLDTCVSGSHLMSHSWEETQATPTWKGHLIYFFSGREKELVSRAVLKTGQLCIICMHFQPTQKGYGILMTRNEQMHCGWNNRVGGLYVHTRNSRTVSYHVYGTQFSVSKHHGIPSIYVIEARWNSRWIKSSVLTYASIID